MKNNTTELVNHILSLGITQTALADFLGVARQTIKKVQLGYVPTAQMPNLEYLKNRKYEEILKILEMYNLNNDIFHSLLTKDSEVLEKSYEGFKYIHHWCTDKKYPVQFLNYLFGHVVNFHTRYSPYALVMRDYFDRESYPIVTFNIDYKNKLIKSYFIKYINPKEDQKFSHRDFKENIMFEDFIDDLEKRLGTRSTMNVYLDQQDDEFQFIRENLKKDYATRFDQFSYFDFSRLFNYFETNSKVGPVIEDVLHNFGIAFDLNRLLKNPQYRAEKIYELVYRLSLNGIRDKTKTDPDRIFDGSSKNSKKNYIQEKRRSLKTI